MNNETPNEIPLMKRKGVQIGLGIIILLVIITFIVDRRSVDAPGTENTDINKETSMETGTSSVDGRVVADSSVVFDVGSVRYSVEGQEFTLVNGSAESQIPGSQAKAKLTVLEGPAFADVNGDGVRDAVVLLRSETGGTGIFYYVAAVLSSGTTGSATNAILLGDRIRITSISVDNQIISVNILNRKEGEPMTTAPSMAQTHKFSVSGNTLIELK